MGYRAYGSHTRGYSHEKRGVGAEDYAASFADPEGRYQIAVICDGHSDKNCFRSAKGAEFGCKAAVEQLSRFFELYFGESCEKRSLPAASVERLKKSIKISWERKVAEDLKAEPIRPEELEPLTERVRNLYLEGKSLSNIYGATFLAVAVCGDFFLALHVGDGVILAVSPDGRYYRPLPTDPKGETGSPASLCDSDLFTRENAFRSLLTREIPQIATVSSDGIEDCMNEMAYKRLTEAFFKSLKEREQAEQAVSELNDEQKKYWQRLLEHYAKKGNGAEDDCSLSAVWDPVPEVPELVLSAAEAVALWNQIVDQRNSVVYEYDTRIRKLLQSMQEIPSGFRRTEEQRKKLLELRQVLGVVVENEDKKLEAFDSQLSAYEIYLKKSGADRNLLKPMQQPFAVSPDNYEVSVPKTLEPKAEDTKPEDLHAGEPKAEDTKPEDLHAGEPKAEDTKPEDLHAGEPKAEDLKPEDTKTDENLQGTSEEHKGTGSSRFSNFFSEILHK